MGIFSEISRIEGSEFRAEVDEIIWLLTHGSQLIPVKSKVITYLYDASFIEDTFDHALILIQTSKDHPLTMSELQMLQEITRDLPPEAVIHWGVGTNEDLKDKVFLMIVYSK